MAENFFPAMGVPVAVPAGAGVSVLKAGPGVLLRCMVTVTGAVNAVIFDNAAAGSGTNIGIIPSTAAVGQVFEFNMPATLGITVGGAATRPAFTAAYL